MKMIPRLLTITIALAITACSTKTIESDPQVVAAVQKTLSSRLKPVNDYRVAGVVENVGTQEKLGFTYAMKQPGFMRAALGEQRVFVTDGKILAVHDHPSKTAIVRDLGSLDEPTQLIVLHDTFSDFVCDGWRPPLVRPKQIFAKQDGDRWHITVPIDDADVSEQRVVLRASDGAFLEKSIVDKAGKPTSSTKVIEEFKDATTGLSFPKIWERTDATGTYRVTLASTEINVGLAPETFSTVAPEGYKLQP